MDLILRILETIKLLLENNLTVKQMNRILVHYLINFFFSTTGVTKAVVCAILSLGWCILKNHLLLIEKSSLYSGFYLSLSE